MKRYSLINNNDGNDVVELESTDVKEALFEGLNYLGWGLIEDDEEDAEIKVAEDEKIVSIKVNKKKLMDTASVLSDTELSYAARLISAHELFIDILDKNQGVLNE